MAAPLAEREQDVLRKVTMIAAALALTWWARGGDPHSLKREIVELRDSNTQFVPDGTIERSDWAQ
jgi:hypothetical protein